MSIQKKLFYLKKQWFPSKEDKIQEKEYEQKMIQFYKQIVFKDDLVFDIGANIGNRVTPLLNIGAKIVAVEPQEKCYKYLNKKFGDKITLVTEGIGEKEGTAEFFISNATTISSFSKDWIDQVKKERFKDFNWNKTETVTMTTLDSLIHRFGLPSFIKIDVEGYEEEVLKGLSHPVKMISFEYTVPEQTDKALLCIELLHKISPKYAFNYSTEECMEFKFSKWQNIEEMKKHIQSASFNESNFGDIYACINDDNTTE